MKTVTAKFRRSCGTKTFTLAQEVTATDADGKELKESLPDVLRRAADELETAFGSGFHESDLLEITVDVSE
jgi:hypothetical protein